MANVTVSEASKLTGKTIPTLYRDIKAGKLPKNADGTVDTVELLRVYGLIKVYDDLDHDEVRPLQNEQPVCHSKTEIEIEMDWLKSQIEKLHSDIKELKSESLERERRAVERENRMMALLEYKAGAGGIFSRLLSWLKSKLNW